MVTGSSSRSARGTAFRQSGSDWKPPRGLRDRPKDGRECTSRSKSGGGAGNNRNTRIRHARRGASHNDIRDVVVLSAHVDGHDLAESAIDNATGVAVALAVARTLASSVSKFRYGAATVLYSVRRNGP